MINISNLRNIFKWPLVVAFLLGLAVGVPIDGVYLYDRLSAILLPGKSATNNTIPESFYFKIDNDKSIKNIESYLDSISSAFIEDVKLLAREHNVPSWGCGPSSYALAKIINDKFFDGKVTIDAQYDNEPYVIAERFGLAEFENNGKKVVGDHAWLEIYFKDRFLYVDPTIAQYGKFNSIVYQLFKIGDPNIRQILNNSYGIIDDRMSLLVSKAVNRVPIDQNPYPGFTIDPAYLNYFLQVFNLRNIVDQRKEPDEWKPWTDTLENEYIHHD